MSAVQGTSFRSFQKASSTEEVKPAQKTKHPFLERATKGSGEMESKLQGIDAKKEVKNQTVEVLKKATNDNSDVEKLARLLFGEKVTDQFEKVGAETVSEVVGAVAKWDEASNEERVKLGAGAALSLLTDLEVINKEKGEEWGTAVSRIASLISEATPDKQKALVAADLLGMVVDNIFDDRPETFGKTPIVGSAVTKEGKPGYLLEDGKVIPESATRNSNYVQAAVQAALILGSDISDADKAIGIAQLGLDAALQADLLDVDTGGALGAGLQIANTINNWDSMNDSQRVVSVISGASSALNGLSSLGSQSAESILNSQVGSALGGLASAVGAGYNIYNGAQQATEVLESVDDLPRSAAGKYGALGGLGAGAAIGGGVAFLGAAIGGTTIGAGTAGLLGGAGLAALGASAGSIVPIIGTAVGALVGAAIGFGASMFGSGKDSGRMMRDGWRDNLVELGMAQKIDDSHHLTLADGTLYNIGRDGGDKIEGHGTTRHYFDVDWNNPLAGDAVPTAHLIAMIAGASHNDRFDLFGRTTAMLVNAATSNATTKEGVLDNFRAFLASSEISPDQIHSQIELKRVTNEISEQEYNVYLKHLSELSGTNFSPTSREEVASAVVEGLVSKTDLSAGETEVLMSIVDETEIRKDLEALNQRINAA